MNGEEDESFTDVTVEVEPEDEDRKEVKDQLSLADTFDTLSVDLTSGKLTTFNLLMPAYRNSHGTRLRIFESVFEIVFQSRDRYSTVPFR